MQIDIFTIILVLIIHWVADFIFQSDWMATNKSKSNKALLAHIGTYTLIMSIAFINPLFGIVNGAIHGVIDYVTSRITSKLYSKGDIHNFFVVIGFDQLLHTITLIITAYYLL